MKIIKLNFKSSILSTLTKSITNEVYNELPCLNVIAAVNYRNTRLLFCSNMFRSFICSAQR